MPTPAAVAVEEEAVLAAGVEPVARVPSSPSNHPRLPEPVPELETARPRAGVGEVCVCERGEGRGEGRGELLVGSGELWWALSSVRVP